MTNLWDFSSCRPKSTLVPPPPPPEKSSFVQTCNRLSQFLKEKGSLRDLGLDIAVAGKFEPKGKLETNPRNLFPASEKLGEKSAHYELVDLFAGQAPKATTISKQSSTIHLEAKNAQMTIFYGGQIYVFDDFPAEKATELVLLAETGSSTAGEIKKSSDLAVASGSNTLPHHTIHKEREHVPSLPRTAGKDIPIARRASLHRFFEKRKDRAVAVAPYQVHGSHRPSPSMFNDEEQLDLRL